MTDETRTVTVKLSEAAAGEVLRAVERDPDATHWGEGNVVRNEVTTAFNEALRSGVSSDSSAEDSEDLVVTESQTDGEHFLGGLEDPEPAEDEAPEDDVSSDEQPNTDESPADSEADPDSDAELQVEEGQTDGEDFVEGSDDSGSDEDAASSDDRS